MIVIDFESFLLLSISIGLFIVMALWYYYDHREKHLYEAERSQGVFHCVKCGKLYTHKKLQETGNCPVCGFRNARLRF